MAPSRELAQAHVSTKAAAPEAVGRAIVQVASSRRAKAKNKTRFEAMITKQPQESEVKGQFAEHGEACMRTACRPI